MPGKLLDNFYMGDFKIPAENNYSNNKNSCPCNKKPMPCKPKNPCEVIIGNSLDVDVNGNDCEIRADIEVARKKSVRIWGQVKDCDGNPIEGALVKLLKAVNNCGKITYIGVAHAVTDCLGFYQFEVCPCQNQTKYRLLVSKAAIGNERVVDCKAYCNPCDSNPCDC